MQNCSIGDQWDTQSVTKHRPHGSTLRNPVVLFFSKILSRRESYVKICNGTGSKTSQYKKLGKVKKNFRLHAISSLFADAFVYWR